MRYILFCLTAISAFAQTAVFPGAIDGDAQLAVAIPQVQTTLRYSIGSSDTSATVMSSTGFVANSIASFSGPGNSNSGRAEEIWVCSVVGNVLTFGRSSCPNIDGRGIDSTSVVAHNAGSQVSAYVDPWHHNSLKASVIAIETATRPLIFGAAQTARPTQDSDTDAGYVVGNWWQSPAGTWKALSVTADLAVWQPQPQPRAPLGSLATPYLAYGVCLLVHGYAGHAFEVTRASDSATLNIDFVSSSLEPKCADWESVDAFCSGTTCGVDTWYDQSGNTKNLTQGTQANMPQIYSYLVGGFRAISFDGQQATSIIRSMANAAVTIPQDGNSVLFIGRTTGSLMSGLGSTYLEMGGSNGLTYFNSSTGGNYGLDASIANSGGTFFLGLFAESDAAVEAFVASPTTVVATSNDSSATLTTTVNSRSLGTITVGNTAKAPNYQGNFDALGLIVWTSALTPTQIASLKGAAYSQYGIRPQFRDTLVDVGDSITAGAAALSNQPWAQQIVPLLNHQRRQYNLGVGGITAQTESTIQAQFTALLTTAASNVAVISLGTNDIAAGTGAAAIEGYLTAIAAAWRAAGAKVVLASVISRNFSPFAADEAVRQQLNTWEAANWRSIADAFANIGIDPIMGCASCYSNTSYFADGVHPTLLGHTYLAAIIATAVNTLQ